MNKKWLREWRFNPMFPIGKSFHPDYCIELFSHVVYTEIW